MRKREPAPDPDAYVLALDGWRRACVESLRAAVRKGGGAPRRAGGRKIEKQPHAKAEKQPHAKKDGLEETVKWGHLVYAANGPVLLIRAEDERVLFGFWRGQRLREIEPRLKPGGKYEMATLEIREGMTIKPAVASRLAREAVALNRTLGDPTKIAKAGRGVDRRARRVSAP